MSEMNLVFLGKLGLNGGGGGCPQKNPIGGGADDETISGTARSPSSNRLAEGRGENSARKSLASRLESSLLPETKSESDTDSDPGIGGISDDQAVIRRSRLRGRVNDEDPGYFLQLQSSQRSASGAMKCQFCRSGVRTATPAPNSELGANEAQRFKTPAEFTDVSTIESVPELVQRLNSSVTVLERHALLDFANEFIVSFSGIKIECLNESVVQEYFSFVRLEAKDDKTSRFLRKWFYSIANKVCKHRLGECVLLEGLECTLHLMDVRAFQRDPSSLIYLCNRLMDKLHKSQNIFSRDTYPTHCHTLFAIRQVLTILDSMSPAGWDPHHRQGLYQRFKIQLESIIEHANHYPTIFVVKLLTENLKQLQKTGLDVTGRDVQRRILSGARGTVYLAAVVRHVATLEFDPGHLEKGFKHWMDALTTNVDASLKFWYRKYQDLNLACLRTLEDSKQYDEFEAKVGEVETTLKQSLIFTKQTELRFGVISLLREIVVNSLSSEVRRKSLRKLLTLRDEWFEDKDVTCGILDALLAIAGECNEPESGRAERALKKWEMIRADTSTNAPTIAELPRKWTNPDEWRLRLLKNAFDAWLDAPSLSEALATYPRTESTQKDCRFFQSVRRELLLQRSPVSYMDRTSVVKKGANGTLFPPPLVEFFEGRAAEIGLLKAAFQTGRDRVIAPPILGHAGIGKSQLAVKVFQQQKSELAYEHAFWIPSSSQRSLTDAYMKIARLFDVEPRETDTKHTVDELRSLLADRLCLYVFDDAPSLSVIQEFMPLDKGHVLITSRAGSLDAWFTKPNPLALKPLDEEEAFSLSQRFGFSGDPGEREALLAVLGRTPRFPLSLCHLFSRLQLQGYSPSEWVHSIKELATSRSSELAKELEQDPQDRIRYDRGIIRVMHHSLRALEETCCSENAPALRVLSQLAYCDTSAIPLQWILLWNSQDRSFQKEATRQALTVLEKYSLIQWDRELWHVYIHAETQLAVRSRIPDSTDLATLVQSLADYVGDLAAQHDNYDKWLSSLPHARALFQAVSEIDTKSGLLQQLANHLALGCHIASLFKESVQWAEKRLELTRDEIGTENTASALSNLALSLDEFGHHQKAWSVWKEALQMARDLPQEKASMTLAMVLVEFGSSSHRLNKNRAALQSFQEARDLIRWTSDELDPCVSLQIMNNMANCYAELGFQTEELELREQALKKAKEIYKDENNPVLISCTSNLGITLATAGELTGALRRLEDALRRNKGLYRGRSNAEAIVILRNLSWISSKLGKKEVALSYSERALEIAWQFYWEEGHIDLARSLNTHAQNLSKSGMHDDGLHFAMQALSMSRRLFQEENHPVLLRSIGTVGFICHRKGDDSLAQEHIKEALFMARQQHKNPEHPTVAYYEHFWQELCNDNSTTNCPDRCVPRPHSSRQQIASENVPFEDSSVEAARNSGETSQCKTTDGHSWTTRHASKRSDRLTLIGSKHFNGCPSNPCSNYKHVSLDKHSDASERRSVERSIPLPMQGLLWSCRQKLCCRCCLSMVDDTCATHDEESRKKPSQNSEQAFSNCSVRSSSPSDASHWTFDSRRIRHRYRRESPSVSRAV